MNIAPNVPTTKNPLAQFAGDVWLDPNPMLAFP